MIRSRWRYLSNSLVFTVGMEQPVSWDVAKDFPGEFTLYEDKTGIPFKVQWDHENESKVQKNKNGVTGWAFVDGVPNQRVHLCCLTPCPCYHPPSKWAYRPAPRHGRLEAPPPPIGNIIIIILFFIK